MSCLVCELTSPRLDGCLVSSVMFPFIHIRFRNCFRTAIPYCCCRAMCASRIRKRWKPFRVSVQYKSVRLVPNGRVELPGWPGRRVTRASERVELQALQWQLKNLQKNRTPFYLTGSMATANLRKRRTFFYVSYGIR